MSITRHQLLNQKTTLTHPGPHRPPTCDSGANDISEIGLAASVLRMTEDLSGGVAKICFPVLQGTTDGCVATNRLKSGKCASISAPLTDQGEDYTKH